MTETSPVALGNPLSADRRPGALGLPFPSTDIRVVDPKDVTRDVARASRRAADPRTRRCSPATGSGPRRPPSSCSRAAGCAPATSCAMDDDGMVVLVDRIKEMIVTGGFKVYPSQVEDHLRAMPGVLDVAVVGVPGRRPGRARRRGGRARPTARGRPRRRARVVRAAARALRRAASHRGADDLPRSQVGKVLRRVVRDRARPAARRLTTPGRATAAGAALGTQRGVGAVTRVDPGVVAEPVEQPGDHVGVAAARNASGLVVAARPHRGTASRR